MTGGAGYAQRHLEHSDYYDEHCRVQSEWHGHGAELLGLRGEVTTNSYRLKDVKSVAVEEWLRSLGLSNGSKAKIRNIMHAVFNHAVRWEWHDRNPITHVRQSAKRKHIPIVLTLEEVEELLFYLEEPTHTAVLVDVMTGLRVGELLALKWEDIDFDKFEIRVTRSISLQHIGECKTEASRKPVPLDARLAESLWNWRTRCAYR